MNNNYKGFTINVILMLLTGTEKEKKKKVVEICLMHSKYH